MYEATVFEGAVVMVQGYELTATGVEWGEHNGKPCVRFTGTCTDDVRNNSIRRTCLNGGRHGGTNYRKP